jgi:hypothetical protein
MIPPFTLALRLVGKWQGNGVWTYSCAVGCLPWPSLLSTGTHDINGLSVCAIDENKIKKARNPPQEGLGTLPYFFFSSLGGDGDVVCPMSSSLRREFELQFLVTSIPGKRKTLVNESFPIIDWCRNNPKNTFEGCAGA